MTEQWNNFIFELSHNPLNAVFLILGIILLEVILSFDNAAVLATMVKDLSPKNQSKALRYGILGAYLFRGVALILVEQILEIWWLKPIGGMYLLWMCIQHFSSSSKQEAEEEVKETKKSFLYKYTVGILGVFWSTVLAVEFMDIVFSIDNIFAVVAYTENIIIICIGVFIGILAMRYVAKYFVVLMEKYPFLEKSAFIVIGILGVKLCFSVLVHYGQPEFKDSNLVLVDLSKNQVVQQISLMDKNFIKIKDDKFIISSIKKLKPNNNYEIQFITNSKDLNQIKDIYFGEDKKWVFKTSKTNLTEANLSDGIIYPKDNSINVPLKMEISIRDLNKFSWIESETFDMFISIITLLIFFIPVISVKFFKKK